MYILSYKLDLYIGSLINKIIKTKSFNIVCKTFYKHYLKQLNIQHDIGL